MRNEITKVAIMKRIFKMLFILPIIINAKNLNNKVALSEHLESLLPYIGKTYRGEFLNSTKDDPAYDVAKWERALNGNAIRILHSVNNGEYGGETIIMWNPEKNSLMSWYFTTGGFLTNALVTIEGTKITSIEDVTGNDNGITKVKSIIELRQNGGLENRSKYLMDNIWVDGYKIIYEEDSNATVIFN